MKRITQSILLTVGVIVTACLLAAAAAGVHPGKRCYNEAGDEIPCGDSNYYQTQFAARATARKAGPTAQAVVASATVSPTVSPTPSPTVTPTGTEASTDTPIATSIATQEAASPAASAPQATSTRPPTSMVLVPVLLFGCAGILVVVIVVLAVRWIASRR